MRINKNSFFWKLTLRLELFTHIVPLPFAIYLAAVASGLNSKEQPIMVLICFSWAGLTVIIGLIWRYLQLHKFLDKLETYESGNVSDFEEIIEYKLSLMRYPFKEGIVIILRWVFGATPAIIHTAFTIGFERTTLLFYVLPVVIFMIAPISFVAYFFITENSLREILQRESLINVEISLQRLPRFNYFARIILTIFSLANLPFTLFSYLLYTVTKGYLTVENPLLHILILSVMFAFPLIFVTYILGNSVKKGIDRVSKSLQEVGSGNFLVKLPVDTIDDFSLQSIHLNLIIKKLNSMYSEIKDLNINLEQKVIERTTQVNEMLDQLGKLYADSEEKRKEIEILAESRKKISLVGQMAAGIVHDIKNPMATIKSLAEMLNSDSISVKKREKNLNIIVREMDRLNDLSYEILDFAKGQLNLSIKKENLKEFITEIEQFLKIDFDYSGVKCILDVQYGDTIYIDKARMRRVFINISKNAIEAMYDGKKDYNLTIRTELNPSGEFIIISFQDNGPGLPESLEKRIFEIFATEGKTKGTGLGLFMSKWIIDEHNGKLTYETKSGVGTTFFITLPLRSEIE